MNERSKIVQSAADIEIPVTIGPRPTALASA